MLRRSLYIRGLLAVLAWLYVPGTRASVSLLAQENPVRFAVATTVSKSFHRETEDATRTIPDKVWQTIERSGWKVQLAEFVVDAAPSLRGVRPRGWPSHLTWENSDALHLPTSKLLVVAEKRRNSSGKVVTSSRVGGVLRHELGHAFDMALGGKSRFLSSHANFVNAYQRDVLRLSSDERETFKYYLQGTRAGWQEAFAEAFAVSLGGGSSDVEPAVFKATFPKVVSYVRQVIDSPPTVPVVQKRQPTGVSFRVSKLPPIRGRIFRRR